LKETFVKLTFLVIPESGLQRLSCFIQKGA